MKLKATTTSTTLTETIISSYNDSDNDNRPIDATTTRTTTATIGADSMGPAGLEPPQYSANGARHMVEPPQYFGVQNFIFSVLFQQINATETLFTQCHMMFSKFFELIKFSQSILKKFSRVQSCSSGGRFTYPFKTWNGENTVNTFTFFHLFLLSPLQKPCNNHHFLLDKVVLNFRLLVSWLR